MVTIWITLPIVFPYESNPVLSAALLFLELLDSIFDAAACLTVMHKAPARLGKASKHRDVLRTLNKPNTLLQAW